MGQVLLERIASHCARHCRAMLAALLLAAPVAAMPAVVPTGFTDAVFVGVPAGATAMQFAPDGRLFICQQSGKLLVVQGGRLLATPFLTLSVDATGERGLLGVAFDPGFALNHYVYVYYTAKSPTVHNRVSRFTANGNVAVAGSEKILLELDPLSTATIHNGGAIHVGNDGKLYIAVGDNAAASNAQSLSNVFGKILRINRDGTIPVDNPFLSRTWGVRRSIWALGLRNPFTTAFQASSGRLFINDVGYNRFEEINAGRAGANYGWPVVEGPSTNVGYANPVYAYGHDGTACAITGGTFYEPDVVAFPSWNFGQYFFADYCAGWIRRYQPETGKITAFAAGLAGPVDLKVGPDGALYYLARGGNHVGRIARAVAAPPVIGKQPDSRTIGVGQSVKFSVGASGSAPLSFQWRRNGAAISSATSASYTRSNVQLVDNGAFFDVVVTNPYGRAISESAQLTVLQNEVPSASVTQPVAGTTYAGGNVITYAGSAYDVEDGALPASAFTWWVNLHHENHTHPVMQPVSGMKSGSFTIPTVGETSANVFYRIQLQVRDSVGLTRYVSRDILPSKVTVVLATNPSGLQLRLDGQPIATPFSFVGVVGMQRLLEAVSPQTALGADWVFSSWSDGGAQTHTIRTPAVDSTYVARFAAP